MLFNVNFSDESLLEIRETREYYSQVSLIILKKFDDEFTKSIELLKVNRNHFHKRYRNINIVFTKKFPFEIHYIFENNRIYIQRILHQKRFYK
jgi:hypothetical protein